MEPDKSSPNLLLHLFSHSDMITASDYAELQKYMNKEVKLRTVCDMTRIKQRTSDGRFYIYINRRQVIAPTYPKLIDKLYETYFGQETLSMSDILSDWMVWRRDTTKVTNKTLKENQFLWNSLYRDTDIVKKPMSSLTAQDFSKFFRIMTKDGTMTRKRFNDGKIILNSLYSYAIEAGIATVNPILSVNCRSLNFKAENNQPDIYTLEERRKLLEYLKEKDDIYSLAIQLHFYMIARIGELKALMWSDISGNHIRIQRQLLEEQTMNDDLTFNRRIHNHVDYVKGHTSDGFRDMPLTPKAQEILHRLRELNPDSEFILMNDGDFLTTVTYNRHLKECCKNAGIPYRSSHKIRFCVASALYAKGVPATKLQKLLGHSTLAMTLHYLRDITPGNNCYEPMVDTLDF